MLIETLTTHPIAQSVAQRFNRARWAKAVWLGVVLLLTLFQGYRMFTGGASYADIGWIVFWLAVLATFANPRYGLYALFFFGMLADANLLRTYPFNKNFSSGESLFYIGGAYIFSPLELFLVLLFVSWLGRAVMRRRLDWHMNDLFWPVMVFSGFMVYGLVWGIARGGANLNIGLWEVRPIFYLTAVFLLTSNLITSREHVNTIYWLLTIALFIEGIAGVLFAKNMLNWDIGSVEKITEHSAAIHINTYILLMILVQLYKGSPKRRMIMPLLSPPVIFTYIATQRRTAFLTLGMMLGLMSIFLYKQNRRLFYFIVPPGAVLAVVYVLAFWNVTSAAGMPAQAIKSVVAPDQISAKDKSSDEYRLIENMNSAFTIHTYPLTGVGFGQKFIIAFPMPDISFFDWWEYITHNSIMWIWMKTGFGGFLSMIVMIGMSIMVGVRVIWRMPGGDMSAIAITGTFFFIMHFMYAYLDMSWDTQGMLYLGVTMGIMGNLEWIVDKPVPLPRRRWRWQPDPEPVAGLNPVPEGPLIKTKLW